MKVKEVYKKEYKEKNPREHRELIEFLKKSSHENPILINQYKEKNRENTIYINPYKRTYIGFDGNFLTFSEIEIQTRGYDATNSTIEVTIEKMGLDTKKESEIEKMLLKKRFKKITKK